MTLRPLTLTVAGVAAVWGIMAAPAKVMAGGSSMESMFRSMDTNKDGKVSREEHEEAADRRFEEMDTNDDDKVTVTELEAAQTKMMGGKRAKPSGAAGEPSAADKLQRMDNNRDGVLSEDEFEAGADQMFQMLDANSDGFITKAELDAGHKTLMEKKAGKSGN
jgi:Ca2+-binding EF-hand superfamily protein